MEKQQQKVIITFGEIMIRFKPPGKERFFQTPALQVYFGGGEANVAISLANFGLTAKYVTALPDHLLGDGVIRELRARGVDTKSIIRQGERLGLYFVEEGTGPRPSLVVYDRAHSAIATAQPGDFDWETIFQDGKWFHVTGITPAISESAAKCALEAVQTAKAHEMTVSCDLNYRAKLWKYGKTAPEVMRGLMPYIDVVIANEEDIQKCLGIKIDQKIGGAELSHEKYAHLAGEVFKTYSKVEIVAITLRESISADHNNWSAMIQSRKDAKPIFSTKYALKNIVDRIGGGDSFVAGLIYGLISKETHREALEFAVAASALKHTIPGDYNRVSVEEVERLAQGEASGRVQR